MYCRMCGSDIGTEMVCPICGADKNGKTHALCAIDMRNEKGAKLIIKCLKEKNPVITIPEFL